MYALNIFAIHIWGKLYDLVFISIFDLHVFCQTKFRNLNNRGYAKYFSKDIFWKYFVYLKIFYIFESIWEIILCILLGKYLKIFYVFDRFLLYRFTGALMQATIRDKCQGIYVMHSKHFVLRKYINKIIQYSHSLFNYWYVRLDAFRFDQGWFC